MLAEGIHYISNFISSVLYDENIVRVMKRNNGFNFSKEDFDSISMPENTEAFYCDCSSNSFIKAYEPFIDVARDVIRKYNMDIDILLDLSNVYSLQRSVFKSMFEGEHSVRQEKPILGEIEYERKKFVNGLVSIMLNISKEHNIFIMINNSNLIFDSTLSILEELDKNNSYKLKILVISNEMGNVKAYLNSRYNGFIHALELKGAVMDIPFFVDSGINKFNNESKFNFCYEEQELDEIEDMINTFSIDQAEYYLKLLYQKIELDKISVTEEYRMKMIILYVKACLCKENYSYALVLCDKLRTIEEKSSANYKMYYSYYYRAISNMYIGNEEDAIRDSKMCERISATIDDEFIKFEADMLKVMSQLSGWKNIWICDKKVKISDKFIDLAYKYRYLNHLAHVFVYYFDNDPDKYESIEGVETNNPTVTKGIYIARKLGNEQFLTEAYRKCVMLASCNGHFNTANYFYTKSIDVVKNTDNKLEEANIYNGLGFNCCTVNKYTEANRYYNQALNIFYQEQSSDYIAETLYNMGTNAILAGDYGHAVDYLLAVNNILMTLKKNSLRVCNISKIFGLISVAAFKHGNYYTARLYNSKSGNFLKYILDYEVEDFSNYLWSDDVFLHMYVSGLLAEKEGNYNEALEMFERAEEPLIRSHGSMFFNYVLFSVDKANLYRKIGRAEEATEILRQARKYYEDKGSFLNVRMFDELIATGKYTNTKLNMSLTSITMNEIMQQIKEESIRNQAKTKKEQIKFFGTFQSLVNSRYSSIEEEIETMISTFKNNFNLDNILFINYENGKPSIQYSDFEYDFGEEDILILDEYFKTNTSDFVLSKFDNNYRDYEKILNVFKYTKIFSMLAAPIYRHEELKCIFLTFQKIPESWNAVGDRDLFDEDDLEMYKIVFRQILDAIEKHRLNEKLEKRVITDELTGAYNRNGYYSLLDRKLERAIDTGNKLDFTLMYIDLDHFKYYNDNFGHQVGDDVLKKFVNIFSNVCGEEGYVIRFGGDEFIVLLNSVDREKIDSVISGIYDNIKKENGFIDIVKAHNRDYTKVTLEMSATCSIGIEIGQAISTDSEISTMQKHADAALYYVKEHGRKYALYYDEMIKLKEKD